MSRYLKITCCGNCKPYYILDYVYLGGFTLPKCVKLNKVVNPDCIDIDCPLPKLEIPIKPKKEST